MKRSLILSIAATISLIFNIPAYSIGSGTASEDIKHNLPGVDNPFENGNEDVLMPTLSELLDEEPLWTPCLPNFRMPWLTMPRIT